MRGVRRGSFHAGNSCSRFLRRSFSRLLRCFIRRDRGRNRTRFDRWRGFHFRRVSRGDDRRRRRALQPAQIVEGIGENEIHRRRINLPGRGDPIVRLGRVVMFELPGRLRVVERRCVARELELLHHLLRAAVFAFEKQRQINFEFDDLRDLILVAARRGRGAEERFKPIARLCVILFLERNLREVVLRFAEFRIDLRSLFEGGFCAVEIFLGQQNFAAQINGRGLIWIRKRIRKPGHVQPQKLPS